MATEINLISYGTLIKTFFIYRAKQIKKNLRQDFVDEGQLKTIMPKYKRFSIYTL